jgi:hypothetical protein
MARGNLIFDQSLSHFGRTALAVRMTKQDDAQRNEHKDRITPAEHMLMQKPLLIGNSSMHSKGCRHAWSYLSSAPNGGDEKPPWETAA